MSFVKLSRRAENDLADVHDYIANYSESRAEKTLRRITTKLERLAVNPYLGALCNIDFDELRYFVVKPYVIYFRPIPIGIEVVRVLHGSRDTEGEVT